MIGGGILETDAHRIVKTADGAQLRTGANDVFAIGDCVSRWIPRGRNGRADIDFCATSDAISLLNSELNFIKFIVRLFEHQI